MVLHKGEMSEDLHPPERPSHTHPRNQVSEGEGTRYYSKQLTLNSIQYSDGPDFMPHIIGQIFIILPFLELDYALAQR